LGLPVRSHILLIANPETSVLDQPTLRNIPEDGRIQVSCSESLHSFWYIHWQMTGILLKTYQFVHAVFVQAFKYVY
jgi:hypothetical protein